MCVFWAARPVMSPWGWCHSGQVLEGTFPTSPGRWQSMIHGEKNWLARAFSLSLSPSLPLTRICICVNCTHSYKHYSYICVKHKLLWKEVWGAQLACSPMACPFPGAIEGSRRWNNFCIHAVSFTSNQEASELSVRSSLSILEAFR